MAVGMLNYHYPTLPDETGCVDFLATIHFFRALPTNALRQVAAVARPTWVGRGDFIFCEGNPLDAVYVIVEGRAKEIRETEDGEEVIIRLPHPGDVLGIIGSWNAPRYRTSALAQESCLVLALPRDFFVSLLGDYPPFMFAILLELGGRLGEIETRVVDLQTRRAVSRLARAILHLGQKAERCDRALTEITLALSRQDLAELAGTNVSTASRTLREWERRGIVAARRERVRILRPHALAAIAAAAPSLMRPDARG